MTNLERLDVLEKRVAILEARATAQRSAPATTAGGVVQQPGKEVATDYDMDGEYGDPVVFSDPPQWLKRGKPAYKGKLFSDCPSDYLIAQAEFLEWKASKSAQDGDQKRELFCRADAARARGWARRNAGKPAQPVQVSFADEEIPF